MKYKKGNIVEVLDNVEFSYQSWRCARIVSANQHNYTVNYHVYPGFTNEEDVEYVTARYIRPCPHLLEVSECWVPGDVVEVFHNLSWETAVVLKDCGWEDFLVRLVGSSQEFEVYKSAIRVRQSYENGKWIVIGNGTKDHSFDTQHDNNFIESQSISSKTLKRKQPSNCYEMTEHKFKVSKKENINQTKLELNNNSDSVSMMSSSGSCGVNGYKSNEMESGSSGFDDSDAESVCQSAASEPPVDEIHKLELEAYSSRMVELHASGPLNWEKEAMVTELRMSLHISNDEHLIMVKKLISGGSSYTSSR